MQQCVIYTRFSPRPDAADSESCDFQRAKCYEFAAQKGWAIRAAFDDPDRSGADEYREQLWNAVKSLKKGDALLVYKRDRIARDVYLMCYVERAVKRVGASVVAVSGDVEGESPEAQMVRIVVAAMSEYERKMIKQRTRDAMRTYQKAGRRMSAKLPYGWRIDPENPQRLIRDPEETANVRMALKMNSEGKSWGEIADSLNKAGRFRRNGKPWDRSNAFVLTKKAERSL